MLRIFSLKVWVFFLFPLFTFAFEPGTIAKVDRSLWPYKMESSKSFDVASKCEMLVFISVLNQYNGLSDLTLSEKINTKKPNSASIKLWKEATKIRIIANFKNLSDESLKDIISIKKNSSWETLSALELEKLIPINVAKWYESALVFYTNYINEQLRLAALNPRLTSEILPLSINEINGQDFSQKNFMLTFDDGPTPENGTTDKLIKMLEDYKLSGMFFVLGNNLNSRLESTSSKKLIDLYGNNLVLSHGKTHVSHQKYNDWKESLDYTNDLINKIFGKSDNPKMLDFRPPYAQRNKLMLDYLSAKKAKVILWNMDSQDWSAKINAQEVADRQITLMLLWRKGILLFHDVHPKAQIAVPIIYDYFKNANLTWVNPNGI
jgi:peptidoglycan-N-acetylglucosamine deacetylase